jgi:hypothetical protein
VRRAKKSVDGAFIIARAFIVAARMSARVGDLIASIAAPHKASS